jgi:hypothetical protein
MIISRLNGGIGNQMFQYALGRHLAYLNNTELKLDISTLSKDNNNNNDLDIRKFELSAFNIECQIATQKDISSFIHNGLIINKYIKKLNHVLGLKCVFNETGISFQASIFSNKKNVYLNGYWQSEKYFSPIKHIIKRDFILKNNNLIHLENYISLIKRSNSVSIHFRRGDYVSNQTTNSLHGICDFSYYKNAIDYISKKIKDPNFFIFSDDINWVQNNFSISFPTTFIKRNNIDNSYEELFLMSLCKHNIIANSSFSWWGAWLNNNSDKIIIAPKRWFSNESMNNQTNDIIPQNWIRL